MSYIVRCALPLGHTITMKDGAGNPMPLGGQIGMAPEWETGACNKDCQEKVSACVFAHVNTSGKHIALWLDGPDPALGWGRSAAYPYQEGSFFGNMFLQTPVANYCNGVDFEFGVVPGRLGAGQSGAPYTDPIGTNALCSSGCTAASGTYPNNDGFSVCYGVGGIQYKHIVTVYRDFDPTTPYKVCDKQTGSCLTAQNATAGSTIVRAAYGATNANQRWMITQSSAGKYKLANVGTGMVLDMAGGRSTTGTALVQAASTGSATQAWVFKSVQDGTGYFQIQPSTTTLNALGVGTGSNMQLEAWSWADDEKLRVSVAN